MHPPTEPVAAARVQRGHLLDVLQHPEFQRVYVHDYSDIRIPSLDRLMAGLGSLRAERALVMAQPGDLVLVTRAVEQAYLDYLDQIGLGPGAGAVVPLYSGSDAAGTAAPYPFELLTDPRCLATVAERLEMLSAPRLSPFFSGPGTHALKNALQAKLKRPLAVDGGSPEATVLANRKDLLREQATALAIPVAPGTIVAGTNQSGESLLAAVKRRQMHNGAVMVRAAWSGGGLDNLAVRSREDAERLPAWLAARPHIETCLVESLLAFEASPNVQLWVRDDGTCQVLETTNQRLDRGLAHAGNAFPFVTEARAAMEASAAALGQWLSAAGYRGPLGMDFLITMDTGAIGHRFVEVNGRVNGATYGIAVWSGLAVWARLNQQLIHAGRPAAPAWISTKQLDTRCRRFDALVHTLGGLLYQPGASRGVVPYNTGLLASGGISCVIVAGSVAEAEDLERQLLGRLAS